MTTLYKLNYIIITIIIIIIIKAIDPHFISTSAERPAEVTGSVWIELLQCSKEVPL